MCLEAFLGIGLQPSDHGHAQFGESLQLKAVRWKANVEKPWRATANETKQWEPF